MSSLGPSPCWSWEHLLFELLFGLKVSRQAIYDLKEASVNLKPGETPRRKEGSGRPRKTSCRINTTIIKFEVMENPSVR